jgi:hypothetical protein
MFHKQTSRPLFWGLVVLGTLSCVPVMAQETVKNASNNASTNAPLSQPSAFEAIDQVAKTNAFWSETSIGEDAKNIFVIDRDEARIQRRSERFETVYLDLMKQQNEAGSIMRTQDISNLYDTSLIELQK